MGEGLKVNGWGEGESVRVNGWGWMGEVRMNQWMGEGESVNGWGVGESMNGWVWMGECEASAMEMGEGESGEKFRRWWWSFRLWEISEMGEISELWVLRE